MEIIQIDYIGVQLYPRMSETVPKKQKFPSELVNSDRLFLL